MAEDARRSAEIRRMASQKVAAELIKYQPFSTDDELDKAFSHFLDLTDRIDRDVVEAGDAASGSRFPSGPPIGSQPGDKTPPPTPTLQEPSKPANGAAGGLSAGARAKMIQLLEGLDPEAVKWKLYQLGLTNTPEDAAKEMTVDQGREIAKWSRKLNKESA